MNGDRRRHLIEAVYDFAGQNPLLATSDGSFDRCTSASKALIEHLDGCSINALPVRFSGIVGEYPEAHGRWKRIRPEFWTHYAILAEGIVVDLTACQFDPDAEFPFFLEAGEAASMWQVATVLEGFGDLEIGPLLEFADTFESSNRAPTP